MQQPKLNIALFVEKKLNKLKTMTMVFIDIITRILLCLQCAFAGISAYGMRHEGTIHEEEIEKYAKLHWTCFVLILVFGLIGMLFNR